MSVGHAQQATKLLKRSGMNEMITPFGQLQPLQGGNLARVADLKEVDHQARRP